MRGLYTDWTPASITMIRTHFDWKTYFYFPNQSSETCELKNIFFLHFTLMSNVVFNAYFSSPKPVSLAKSLKDSFLPSETIQRRSESFPVAANSTFSHPNATKPTSTSNRNMENQIMPQPYQGGNRTTDLTFPSNSFPPSSSSMAVTSSSTSSSLDERMQLDAEYDRVAEAISAAVRAGRDCSDLRRRRTEVEDRLLQLSSSSSSSMASNSCYNPQNTLIPAAQLSGPYTTTLSNHKQDDIYSSSAAYPQTTELFNSDVPLCQCNLPCVKLVSRQATSLDREFYKCSLREGQCTFFKWAVEETPSALSGFVNGTFSDSGASPHVKDPKVEIKKIFGHDGFRYGKIMSCFVFMRIILVLVGQLECVEQALKGRDVFCLMPTGSSCRA